MIKLKEQQIIDKVLQEIGEEHLELMRKYEVIIAGGALTSTFTMKPINDIDCYFKSKEHLIGFLYEIKPLAKYSNWFTSDIITMLATNKALMVKDCEADSIVQYVYNKFYETSEDIFNNFDFTINMASIELSDKGDKIVLDPRFVEDNIKRKLVVNTDTQYPLVSLFRVDKYADRGYTISLKDRLLLLTKIMMMNIDSWEEAKEQFSGFYGSGLEHIIDEGSEEFSLEKLIKCVQNSYVGVEESVYLNTEYLSLSKGYLDEKIESVIEYVKENK